MAKKRKKTKKKNPSAAAKKQVNRKAAAKQKQREQKKRQAPRQRTPQQTNRQQSTKRTQQTNAPRQTQAAKSVVPEEKREIPAAQVAAASGPAAKKASATRRRRGRFALCFTAVLLIAALAVAGMTRYLGFQIPDSADSGYAGRNVAQGTLMDIRLTAADQKAYCKAMHARGDTKAFGFYCSRAIHFARWNDAAVFGFGNISANDCVLIASVYVPSFSETDCVYRSLGVPPGKELPKIDKLFYALEDGVYRAKICVAAYQMEAPYDLIGVQVVSAKLTVGAQQ